MSIINSSLASGILSFVSMLINTSRGKLRTLGLFGLVVCAPSLASAATYYVAPSGSNSGAGTQATPFATLQRAVDIANPGDTIYMRGGTYKFSSQTNIGTRDGSSGNHIKVFAYPGETPVIDAINASGYGLALSSANFWHIKGLEVKNAAIGITMQNCNDNILENLNVHHNGRNSADGRGIRMMGSSANNLILNNDLHHNRDTQLNNADAMLISTTGAGNVLRGNRMWNNSDDGLDLFCASNGVVCASILIENNWAYDNGQDDAGNGLGNGCGFKLGGTRVGTSGQSGGHTVRNNLAWSNRSSGFDNNCSRAEANCRPNIMNNNTAWNNPNNYVFWTNPSTFRNNINFGNLGKITGSATYNSWTLPVTVSTADFASMDDTCYRAPRKADGSLPTCNFLHLVSGSDLIDKGTNVGISYNGSAPDLGVYEYSGTGTDSTPPTVSITAPASGATVSGTAMTVSANASDNVGVSGVQFKLDGTTNLGTEDTTSPYSLTWNSTATNGSHTLSAVARDAAGNSATSASVSVTVNNAAPDPTPPTVSITAPTSGATVSGTAVTVSTTASDNVGVAGVQFKLDGANLGAEDTASPYSVTWNTTTATNGSHTLTTVARDAAGNTATSAAVTVKVNNTGPSPLPDVIVTSLSYASGVFTSTVKNQGTGAAPAGILIGVGYSVDGVSRTWGGVSGPLAAGASVTIGTNGGPYTIPTGTHTFTAHVDDVNRFAESNETNNLLSQSITVGDTQAPTVSVTAPANGTTVSGTSVAVSANASDNVGVSGVQFKLDGANLGAEDTTSPYSVTWNSTTAGVGSHTLTAVARDAAGKTTTSAGVSVTVPDTTSPTVSFTAPANGAPVSGSVTVSANASDNVGVGGVQFKLDGANLGAEDITAPYSIVWNSTTATIGSHTLTAVARDAAKNIGTSVGVTVTVKSGPISLWKLDESSGTTASDFSGTNTATLSGGASFTAGRLGNALKLNGIDGQVKANATTGLNLTQAITTAAWVKYEISLRLDIEPSS